MSDLAVAGEPDCPAESAGVVGQLNSAAWWYRSFPWQSGQHALLSRRCHWKHSEWTEAACLLNQWNLETAGVDGLEVCEAQSERASSHRLWRDLKVSQVARPSGSKKKISRSQLQSNIARAYPFACYVVEVASDIIVDIFEKTLPRMLLRQSVYDCFRI